MKRLFVHALSACVLVCGALMLSAQELEGQQGCGNWTRWSPVHPLSVLWSWRLCETISERFEVQWRFANTSSEEVEFEYELFTGMGNRCGDNNRGTRFAGGKFRLGPGQRDDRYSGRRRLRRSGFQQRFWLYLCVKNVSSGSA